MAFKSLSFPGSGRSASSVTEEIWWTKKQDTNGQRDETRRNEDRLMMESQRFLFPNSFSSYVRNGPGTRHLWELHVHSVAINVFFTRSRLQFDERLLSNSDHVSVCDENYQIFEINGRNDVNNGGNFACV